MSSKSTVIVYSWAGETTVLWSGMKMKMNQGKKLTNDDFFACDELSLNYRCSSFIK